MITACGYNLFNEYIHSDHRAIFVDISLKKCFGHGTPLVVGPNVRFISTSSLDIQKFVDLMHSHLTENKVFPKYQDFRLDRDILAQSWRQANQIDDLLGQAFRTAELKCLTPPKPPWSKKLHLASLKVRYWKTVLTERLTKVPQSTVLRNLAAELWPNGPPAPPRSTCILKNVAAAAQKALRRVRRYTAKEREQFLNELKARLASRMSSTATDVDAAIRSIDRQLVDGKRFGRISRALKPTANVSLTKLEIVTQISHIHPNTGATVTQRTVKIVDTRKALEDATNAISLRLKARRLPLTSSPRSDAPMHTT
jgi:hypothetical protein